MSDTKTKADEFEWTDSPRRNPPPEGVMVEVRGDCFQGVWTGKAQRKNYKPGSTRGQLRRVWRWCHKDGTACDDQAIDAWRHIAGGE